MVAKHQKILLVVAAVGLAFLATKPLVSPVPLVIWNTSDSVPVGLYLISKRQPNIGEIAIIKPAEWVHIYAASRAYLPEDAWLLKPIYAVRPSTICRFGKYVFVDGKHVAKAKNIDKMGRVLPVWKGCKRLAPAQLFVLGHHRDSFDSRYFGPVDNSQVVGTAFPLVRLFK
jgi:conjugative transfer signal peptidase TraF